jgi:hypothetical protein
VGEETKKPQDKLTPAQRFFMSLGIQSLFSIYPKGVHDDDMEDEAVDRALSPPSDEAEGSASDDADEEHPLEATMSRGGKLLEIDEDDDEEMGEMVAPLKKPRMMLR